MSGSTGGNRIAKSNVEKTVKHYQETVLNLYNYYQDSKITGSYNCSNKKDFGDIDLIVELSDLRDKKEVKKEFVEFLKTFPDYIIIPFKSDKYKGKKFLNTGEIITILYPMICSKKGKIDDSKTVQIDNIISTSPNETNFKNEFLNLPAIKQGLILGIVKTAILEDPSLINIIPIKLPKLSRELNLFQRGQEFEFNLSSSFLTLRLIDLDIDFKTTNKRDVWKSTNWALVEKIVSKYDFNKDFKLILEDIKNTVKNPRTLVRIKGIFNSMVSVKTGEIGTEKGKEKEEALKLISSYL